MLFCMVVQFQQNFVWGSRTADRQGLHDKNCKFLKSNVADRHFEKSLNRHISVKNCPILMKFGTLHQLLNPVTVKWPTIEIIKIQDGGGRHLEIGFFGHNSSTGCPISAKFRMRKQNSRSTRAKNRTWRTAAILKIVKLPYLSEKSSEFDEIWYTASDIEPRYSHVTKNCNFCNLRWQRPPSWKSLFWPLLINRLSDFIEILYEKAERHADKGCVTKKCKCVKFKMADGRHFENR